MLKRARILGYKCLTDVTVDLGPFNVLIGRNDSGKSSFLQAIAEPTHWLVQGTSRSGLTGWNVRLDGEKQAVRFHAASLNLPEITVAPPGGVDHQFLGPGWSRTGAATYWTSEQAEFVATDPIMLDPAHIAGPANARAKTIEAFVENRGGGTVAHLASLALGDRPRFDAIEEGLRAVTKGRVKAIKVDDVGDSTYELTFRLFDGTVIPASHLSTGLLIYLAFLSLIHRDPVPAILLIEEPEAGLHPLRLFEVVELLRSLTTRGTQVILTTHSPDLLNACKPSEVRVFYRPNPESPTEVHVLPADFERRAMRDTLGEVWASRGEEGLLDLVTKPLVPSIQADPK